MQRLLTVQCWPLWVAALVHLLSSAAFAKTGGRIPNRLTYPAAVAGWLAALVVTVFPLSARGSVGSSLLATGAVLLLLWPLWRRLGCGGVVKAQAAFAAWVGCAAPVKNALGLIAISTAAGVAIAAIGDAVYRILARFGIRRGPYLIRVWNGQNEYRIHGTLDPWQVFPAEYYMALGSIAGLAIAARFLLPMGGAP